MPPLWQPKNHHKLPSQSWFHQTPMNLLIHPTTAIFLSPAYKPPLPNPNNNILHLKASYQTEKKQNKKISQSSCCKLSLHCWQKEGRKEEFSKSMSKARKLNCNIWVAGDFNLPKMDCDHPCYYSQCGGGSHLAPCFYSLCGADLI